MPLAFKSPTDRQFSDVYLTSNVADGTVAKQIDAHKFTLANESKYFNTMFSDSWNNQPVTPLLAIDHATLEMLISFMYVAHLDVISMQDAMEVLEGASYHNVTENLL